MLWEQCVAPITPPLENNKRKINKIKHGGIRMENKRMKKNSGITLVALVVTIIVLLILAGITIAMLTGENGIINKAFQAKDATEYAQVQEEVMLAWTEVQADAIIENYSKQELADKLEEVLQKTDPNAKMGN